MKEYIEERVLEVSRHIIETGSTVRAAAAAFRVSKSTVHKDVTERIAEIDVAMAKKVCAVLQKNMEERHIRGGNATRDKYERIKKRK